MRLEKSYRCFSHLCTPKVSPKFAPFAFYANQRAGYPLNSLFRGISGVQRWEKPLYAKFITRKIFLPVVELMTAHSSSFLPIFTMEISYDLVIGRLEASAQLFSLWRWLIQSSLPCGAFWRKISSCSSFLIEARWAPWLLRLSFTRYGFHTLFKHFSLAWSQVKGFEKNLEQDPTVASVSVHS